MITTTTTFKYPSTYNFLKSIKWEYNPQYKTKSPGPKGIQHTQLATQPHTKSNKTKVYKTKMHFK